MLLSVAEVTRIAREVVRADSPEMHIAGVTVTSGGSGYTEVMLTVDGCVTGPCQVALGVFRDVAESDLREQLATALRTHRQTHTSD